jgi:hypothetical protein
MPADVTHVTVSAARERVAARSRSDAAHEWSSLVTLTMRQPSGAVASAASVYHVDILGCFHFTEQPRGLVSGVPGARPSRTASSASRSQRASCDGSS